MPRMQPATPSNFPYRRWPMAGCMWARAATTRAAQTVRRALPENSKSSGSSSSRFDLEGQPRARNQALNQAVAKDGGRRPEAPGLGGLVNVQSQARGGLTQHLAGGTVAGIAISGPPGAQMLSSRGYAEKAQIKRATALSLGARALTGL